MVAPVEVPRGFRRKIAGVLLSVGLLPALMVGLVSYLAIGGVLSVSFAPMEAVLETSAAELERCGRVDAVPDIGHARLFLAEAELARASVARRAPRLFWGALGIGAASLGIAAVLLGRALTQPLMQLTQGIVRYAEGDLEHQIPESSASPRDEMQFLIGQFNRMGRQLEMQRRQLRLTEKLTAGQDVARNLAHELRNPLTAMGMAVARLERADPTSAGQAERRTESLALLHEEINVLNRMAQSFAEVGKLPPARPELLDVGSLLEEVSLLYQTPASVAVQCRAPRGVQCHADPHQLRRVFANLVKNAVEASEPTDDPVEVDARTESGKVRVTVTDHGCGLPSLAEDHSPELPPPTTKSTGSGLGLAISHRIVRDHGGTLRLTPASPKGTVATVELPGAREE